MRKQELEFVVKSEERIIQVIGKASIYHPTIHYNGAKTKWFDDSKLLKKEVSKAEKNT